MGDDVIISRAWAMPNADTFTIKPIKELIQSCFDAAPNAIAVDPFVRNSPFKSKCVSNDLDTEIESDYHMDALDFLKTQNGLPTVANKSVEI